MMIVSRRDRDGVASTSLRPGSSLVRTKHTLRAAAWLVLAALLIPAVGCGGGSSKKAKESTTVADAEPAQDEEKVAPELAQFVKKRPKLPEKAAAPQPPAASTKDITKWAMADLDSALARKDLMFVPAVFLFSARGTEDAKRAEDLDALARRVGRMKDDAPIPLPFPPGAFAAADKAGKPAAASPGQPSAAAVAEPPAKGMQFKFGPKHKKD
ncbi:MAG TPA: hypothetical protein VMR25_26180 [Planctomycetaceae bacterium]|jgi:hypothetical protein|nr:hypothetical protein [Planctomycetaceae bacterium]